MKSIVGPPPDPGHAPPQPRTRHEIPLPRPKFERKVGRAHHGLQGHGHFRSTSLDIKHPGLSHVAAQERRGL